jgi:hypothetical protein
MEPMPGVIDAFIELSERFDTYILSTTSDANPSLDHDSSRPADPGNFSQAIADYGI